MGALSDTSWRVGTAPLRSDTDTLRGTFGKLPTDRVSGTPQRISKGGPVIKPSGNPAKPTFFTPRTSHWSHSRQAFRYAKLAIVLGRSHYHCAFFRTCTFSPCARFSVAVFLSIARHVRTSSRFGPRRTSSSSAVATRRRRESCTSFVDEAVPGWSVDDPSKGCHRQSGRATGCTPQRTGTNSTVPLRELAPLNFATIRVHGAPLLEALLLGR